MSEEVPIIGILHKNYLNKGRVKKKEKQGETELTEKSHLQEVGIYLQVVTCSDCPNIERRTDEAPVCGLTGTLIPITSASPCWRPEIPADCPYRNGTVYPALDGGYVISKELIKKIYNMLLFGYVPPQAELVDLMTSLHSNPLLLGQPDSEKVLDELVKWHTDSLDYIKHKRAGGQSFASANRSITTHETSLKKISELRNAKPLKESP